MTKILCITPHKRNCNSWWRSVGPLNHLEKITRREIQVDVLEENFTWDVISKYDIVFLHRPFRPDHLEAMQVARMQNIPVWVDYDDWLFDLPKWNGCAGMYANAQVKMIMSLILACADYVTCSTQELKTQFLKVNPNVTVIPNADRPDMFPYRTDEITPRQDIFVWRGTDTHDGDLESVFEGFWGLPKPTYFLGSPLWRLIESMPAGMAKVMGEQDTFQYFKYIHDLRPKVMLFPLADNYFNRCKSNIAWMEAIHAGAICVAPNWPEWRQPGVINYEAGNEVSFLQAAEEAMNLSPEDHAEQIKLAREHIEKNFSFQVVNQRKELIEDFMNESIVLNNKDPFCQLTQMWAFCKMTGKPMVSVGAETLQSKNLGPQ